MKGVLVVVVVVVVVIVQCHYNLDESTLPMKQPPAASFINKRESGDKLGRPTAFWPMVSWLHMCIL